MTAEHQPSPSPEQDNERRVPRIEGVPDFLQIEEVDQMRDEQGAAILRRIQEMDLSERLSDEERAQIAAEVVAQKMHSAGIAEDDPHYQQAQNFLRSVSIDTIPNGAWHSPSEDQITGEHLPSGRQAAKAELAANFTWNSGDSQSQPTPSPDGSPQTSPEAPETGPTNNETSSGDEGTPGSNETTSESGTETTETDTTTEDDPETTPLETQEEQTQAAPELTPEQEAALLELERRWNEATDVMEAQRDEYLRRRAGNARRAIHIRRDFRNGSVAEARDVYERARRQVVELEAEALRIAGEDVNAVINEGALQEEHALAEKYRQHRLVATGNYEFNDDGEMVEVKRGFVGRQMNKFYNWFGSVNAGKGRFSMGALKKGVVMGSVTGAAGLAVGATTGLLLAPVGGMVLAGVGAGYLAGRITKAYMATHMNKKSVDANDQHAQLQHQELMASHAEGETSMADLIDAQSKREVRRNRIRTGAIIGATAVSGALGVAGGNLLHNWWYDNDAKAISGEAPKAAEVAKPEAPRFGAEVNVEAGHGYTHEIGDLFSSKGITLTAEQKLDAYNNLVQKFPNMHGNFFTDDPGYVRSAGDYGISRPGTAHWNDAVLRELDAWGKARNL